MIAANKIIYNGLSSIDLDLLVDVSFDSDDGETSSFLNREAIASESYKGDFRRVHNYKWNEVFSPKFTFVKKDFSDFSKSELRRLYTWLTSKSTADFVTVYYDDSEVISWEALGGFIECSAYKIANNRTVGVVATFESVSPFAFSRLYTITKDVSNPTDNKIIINLETDDPQNAVYPRITIQQDGITNVISINHPMTDADNWVEGSIFQYILNDRYYWVDDEGLKHDSGTNDSGIETTSVSIANNYTGDNDDDTEIRVFNALVKNNIKGEMITLDGANNIVASSRANGRIFDKDFSWEWIPLYEGKNTLSFVGNCTVTIEYRHPIKCGEF